MPPLTTAAKHALTATVAHWRDADLDEFIAVERGRPGELELLLEPQTEAELSALIRALRAHGIQTATIAGQSGLVEAQRPHGVAISLKRFAWIGEVTLSDGASFAPGDFDAIARRYAPAQLRGARLRVGAGTTVAAVNEALAAAGLKLPIALGSAVSASVGGCVANASAGANAICYGTGADLALSLRGVLGTGEIIAEQVPRRASGNDPDECRIRADRFLFSGSLAGSQGALGLITEVTCRVFPLPRDQAIALLPVPDLATAIHLLGQLRARFAHHGQAIELCEIIAQGTLARALSHAGQALREGVGRAPYYVMLLAVSEAATPAGTFGSQFVTEVVAHLMTAATGLDGSLMFAHGDFDCDHDPGRLLRVRESCSEMNRTLPKQAYDVVVPLARLDAFVTALRAAMRDEFPAFRLELFGHVGVGALHLHAIAPAAAALELASDALDERVFDLVQAQGGSPWAEHGIGRKWGAQWQRRTPPDVLAAMLRLKRRCDPDNVIGSRLFGFHLLLNRQRRC